MGVVALSLVAQTAPFAGIVILDKENDWADLFTVVYFSVVGLLVAAMALLDDINNFSNVIGISTEAFMY